MFSSWRSWRYLAYFARNEACRKSTGFTPRAPSTAKYRQERQENREGPFGETPIFVRGAEPRSAVILYTSKGILMLNALSSKFTLKNKRTDRCAFRPGDTPGLHVKIREGDTDLVQALGGPLL